MSGEEKSSIWLLKRMPAVGRGARHGRGNGGGKTEERAEVAEQHSTAQHRSSAFFAPVLGETTNEPNGSLMVVVRATALPHLQYEGDLG